ncbi:ELYS-like domain [Ceraceosorus bombacis]|uniref:ELYS-like domain n=1 Tax=Ceraceosorus bombacis TaxID=401625 RepID=A0A0P1B934_9BASI|nr:ELYS-like domain [Ceraceosorus bombacis]
MDISGSPVAASDGSYERIDAPSALHTWFAVPDGFERFPPTLIAQIRARQAIDFPDGLIIDLLLALLIPGPQTLTYPPDVDDLVNAASEALEEADPSAKARVNAIVYYFLLDHAAALKAPDCGIDINTSAEAQDLSTRHKQFSQTVGLPKQYQNAIKGYFLMERGHYREALPLLSGADFQPLLQRALSPLGPSAMGPSMAERSSLLLSLYRLSATSPSAPSPEASEAQYTAAIFQLEGFVTATAVVQGLRSAWKTTEALTTSGKSGAGTDAERQCKLSLLKWVFISTPLRVGAVSELLGTSLSPADHRLLHEFVTRFSSGLDQQCATLALDTLLVRYINAGDYLSAARLADTVPAPLYNEAGAGVEEAKRARALREGRRKLVEGSRNILPDVQRTLLDIQEGLSTEHKRGGSANTAGVGEDSDQEMAMSWEAVGRSAALSQKNPPRPLSATSALRQLPSVADAPRAASHAIDPVGSLLHAVVKNSPNSKSNGAEDGLAPERRQLGSGVSSLDKRSADSMAASPFRGSSLRESLQKPRHSNSSLGTPSRTFDGQQSRNLLISQSPFAGPPRGQRSATGTAPHRRSSGTPDAIQKDAPARASPFASSQGRVPSHGAARVLSSLRRRVPSPSPPADAEMEDGDAEPEPERPRRRGVARPRKRTQAVTQTSRADPTSEAEEVPGGFPESEAVSATSVERRRAAREPVEPTSISNARPQRRTRQRSADLDTLSRHQAEPESEMDVGRGYAPLTRTRGGATRATSTKGESSSAPSAEERSELAGQDTLAALPQSRSARRARTTRSKTPSREPVELRRSVRLSVEPENAGSGQEPEDRDEENFQAGTRRKMAAKRGSSRKTRSDDARTNETDEELAHESGGVRTRSGKSTMPGSF